MYGSFCHPVYEVKLYENYTTNNRDIQTLQISWLPVVRDGCAAEPLLRRQDEPLLPLQEDRAVRLSSAPLGPGMPDV